MTWSSPHTVRKSADCRDRDGAVPVASEAPPAVVRLPSRAGYRGVG